MVNVSRNSLNQIIAGNTTNPDIYHEHIQSITKSLNLPYDYFLKYRSGKLEKWQMKSQKETHEYPERSKLAQELLDDLDELLTVAAFYIKLP